MNIPILLEIEIVIFDIPTFYSKLFKKHLEFQILVHFIITFLNVDALLNERNK